MEARIAIRGCEATYRNGNAHARKMRNSHRFMIVTHGLNVGGMQFMSVLMMMVQEDEYQDLRALTASSSIRKMKRQMSLVGQKSLCVKKAEQSFCTGRCSSSAPGRSLRHVSRC